jgi:hypothetical protein
VAHLGLGFHCESTIWEFFSSPKFLSRKAEFQLDWIESEIMIKYTENITKEKHARKSPARPSLWRKTKAQNHQPESPAARKKRKKKKKGKIPHLIFYLPTHGRRTPSAPRVSRAHAAHLRRAHPATAAFRRRRPFCPGPRRRPSHPSPGIQRWQTAPTSPGEDPQGPSNLLKKSR